MINRIIVLLISLIIGKSLITFFDSDSYKVIRITDGDTIVLTKNDKTIKIRLVEIDTPENRQPFGDQAKIVLAEKILGKNVDIYGIKKDRYGRLLGKVYLNGRYINQEMIKEGYAWQYTDYSKSYALAQDQEFAKSHKLGLWKDKDPIPPWKFRKNKKSALQHK